MMTKNGKFVCICLDKINKGRGWGGGRGKAGFECGYIYDSYQEPAELCNTNYLYADVWSHYHVCA